MATASELATQLTTKRNEHTTWLASFKKADGYDMPADKVDEFHTRNDELDTLQKAWTTATEVEKSAEINEAKLAPQGRVISGGSDVVSESPIKTADQLSVAFKGLLKEHGAGLKALANGERGTVRFELPVESKTLVTLTDNYPAADRQRTTGMAMYYGDVEDLFLPGTTNSNNIEYFVQTTDTDNAAMVGEGSAATDSAYSWTKVTDEVETVQAWVPVSREALHDNAGFESTITGRLAAQLQRKVNQQLLSGTGTTPQLWGCFIRTGFQTQAKGGDPVFDAIGKAILKVEVTGDSLVDGIVMHPTDWWNMRLTRTVDGIYIMGNPGDGPGSNSLFGIPLRRSVGIGAAGTAGVGAFGSQAQVFNNGGITVETSSEHSTFFTERKVAVAVSRRLSVADYRPSAFCTVTGL